MTSVKEIWKRILGTKIESFSTPRKEYIVFTDEEGNPTCNCPDFVFRKGSHWYKIVDVDGSQINLQSCKHIAEKFRREGCEVDKVYY